LDPTFHWGIGSSGGQAPGVDTNEASLITFSTKSSFAKFGLLDSIRLHQLARTQERRGKKNRVLPLLVYGI